MTNPPHPRFPAVGRDLMQVKLSAKMHETPPYGGDIGVGVAGVL